MARRTWSHAILREPTRIVPTWAGIMGSSSPKEVILDRKKQQSAGCSILEAILVFSVGKAGPRHGMWHNTFPSSPAIQIGLITLMSTDMVVSGIIIRELQPVIPNDFMESEELLYSSNICNPPEPSHSSTTHFHLTTMLCGS